MHKSGETPLHKERHACTRTRRFSQNCGQRYALWRSLPISGPETRPGSSWGGVTASPVPGTEKESLALYCLANYQATKTYKKCVARQGKGRVPLTSAECRKGIGGDGGPESAAGGEERGDSGRVHGEAEEAGAADQVAEAGGSAAGAEERGEDGLAARGRGRRRCSGFLGQRRHVGEAGGRGYQLLDAADRGRRRPSGDDEGDRRQGESDGDGAVHLDFRIGRYLELTMIRLF
ncbi:hypothetical protein GW17_00042676 [Ensete ventricosum]|nr:hypothetical protein GW17_00042676 [Ensete ventricosum]